MEMKKIATFALACALSAAAAAAPCQGPTKTGDRCKREAAEGSAYCIGHADQAKPKAEAKPAAKPKAETKAPAGAKEKDDGTCWAVTAAGTRCKHKKDGESDYCKQHAPGVKPSKPLDRCRAMTFDGTQCARKPVEGGRYCKQHSGQ